MSSSHMQLDMSETVRPSRAMDSRRSRFSIFFGDEVGSSTTVNGAEALSVPVPAVPAVPVGRNRPRSIDKEKRKSGLPNMWKKLQKTPPEAKDQNRPSTGARSRSADWFTPPGPARLQSQDRLGVDYDDDNNNDDLWIRSNSLQDASMLHRGSDVSSEGDSMAAWVMGPGDTTDYNLAPLLHGIKVPELWIETGNVYVHLHPGEWPSFKVYDGSFASSEVLTGLMLRDMMERAGCQQPSTRPDGVIECHLYFPLENTRPESLVACRNLFALLTGRPLVGTTTHGTFYAALLQVAGLLKRCAFTNGDGTTYGFEVEQGLDMFLDQFPVADVRHSREKTLEAVVLGEQLRCWRLYNEGFCHAVGKYDALVALKSPVHAAMSASTTNRLERAHLDLQSRVLNAKGRLASFEFPSLFAGVASSTSTERYRSVRFREWKAYFLKMRTFVLGYYKGRFGSWPPRVKAKEKARGLKGGLNRQALLTLYADLCALYDVLVDRTSPTTRAMDQQQQPDEGEADEKEVDDKDASGFSVTTSALRKLLDEFDRSSPPVLPPMPFDVPKMPTVTTVREDYPFLPPKRQAQVRERLQANEIALMVIKSHNLDAEVRAGAGAGAGATLDHDNDADADGPRGKSSFLSAFSTFELREAMRGLGASPEEVLEDLRVGCWLFLYAALQSLPMLVVDAPGLDHTLGVDYFLCEPPQGTPPWVEDAQEVRKMWFQTAGQALVELSADAVMFSVEAIFARSHCWTAAMAWRRVEGEGEMEPDVDEHEHADVHEPGASRARLDVSRGNHGRTTKAYRVSIAGLEPMAAGGVLNRRSLMVGVGSGSVSPSGPLSPRVPLSPRSVTPRTPTTLTRQMATQAGEGSTFDDILRGMAQEEKGTKPKRRFFS